MPAAAGLSDDRRVALPSRPPTQMTRHRIAQIAEKVNPKSPESRPQEGRFLQNRLLHPPHSPAQCQPVSRSSRSTTYHRCDRGVRWAARRGAPAGSWLARMMARKPRMLVAVALANKIARIAWALMA